MEEEVSNIEVINFKVDAGLIERLGRELVGRSETAVSELIKNSYDADARNVSVKFINANNTGGNLVISDDGVGMTRLQLENGFMTISSTDKIHNPRSERYDRAKAGRKGIGRFATQRLGRELVIITQTLESKKALKLTINWDEYKIDKDLVKIDNKVEEVEKTQEEGTELHINNLREWWNEIEIKRIYRYVSDLLQPDYLSDRSKELQIAQQNDSSFVVKFFEVIDEIEKVIADPQKMIFEKAVATIEGWVDINNDGFVSTLSNSLSLDDSNISEILYGKKYKKGETFKGKILEEDFTENKYSKLNNIHFKAYYFIYNRTEYYEGTTKIELKSIQNISKEQGGIRLYRNGFRVLPYGERNNDWLDIDRRYYDDSGTNVPFGNHNLFGFVEILDSEGDLFEETASREGLLENEAYIQLRDFISKSLESSRQRIRFAVKKKKDEIALSKLNTNTESKEISNKSPIEKLDELQDNINSLIESKGDEQKVLTYSNAIFEAVKLLKDDFQKLIDELGMTRVLAGLGLTIGEFTHEVVQFSPSIFGDLSVLSEQELNPIGLNSLENLNRTIKLFTSYTSYFNTTVSANVSRELKPHELDIVVTKFIEIVKPDAFKLNLGIEFQPYGYNLITIPMHYSEWSSILFNLYTNSKKAIKRTNSLGKIKLIVGKTEKMVYLEFQDNGDGVPETNKDKIFDAFFTTSTPAGYDATQDEKLTGTGLGLKIVKDIITAYGGTINLVSPENNYSTCFRIEIPLASAKQKEEYGL